MPFLRSIQKVIIVGNITRTPELRYTANNTPVCSFTVATNRVFVNAKGERKEEAHFHRITVWGKFAEKMAKLLEKGVKVYVEGRLEYRDIRDDAGKLLGRAASIRADEVIILARPRNSSGQQASGQDDSTAIDLNDIAAQISDEAEPIEDVEGAEEVAETEAETTEAESQGAEDTKDELPF